MFQKEKQAEKVQHSMMAGYLKVKVLLGFLAVGVVIMLLMGLKSVFFHRK